jgi:hypothetical protein
VYREGIYEAVQYIKDDKRLKEEIIKLYNRFVRNETQIKEANAHKDFER